MLYLGFAAIATLVNLAAQRVVLAVQSPEFGLIPAMVFGTAAGLLVKYLLDKRWIFHDPSTGLQAHGRLFALYTAAGLVTTLIFWATEYAFWHIGRSETMRELGAVLGLAIGYSLKYGLDRRYVFKGTSTRGRVA